MGQLPGLTREQLPPDHQVVWDRIYSGRTPGGGPYAALMHSPEMAEQFSNVENYFRNSGKLDPHRQGIDHSDDRAGNERQISMEPS